MKGKVLVLKPADRARALDVVGTRITVLASNAQTHAYGITLQQGDEGTGPPPHRHGWDESFYVLEGEIEFQYEGQSARCGAGTLVHVPGGTLHGFRYGRGGGAMLEISGNGAQAAPFFTALDHEMPPGPPDVPRLLEIAQRHGVAFAL